MKNFAVILIICVAAVSTNPVMEPTGGSTKVKVTLKQCLLSYNIDPAVLEPDNKDDYLHDRLSDEKKGCVTACVYRAFNWLRPDGSLDIDLLTEGDTPEESEAEKKKYVRMIEECRRDVGKNDCKFFRCLDTKDL